MTRVLAAILLGFGSVAVAEPPQSETDHVPPAAPEHPMHDMANEQMVELMQMDDAAAVGMVLFDQLEWRSNDDNDIAAWDGYAWYGGDYDKVWLKSEGEHSRGEWHGRAELHWDRLLARWWNLQAGIRHDFGAGPARSWAAFGVQGLAPQWFEIEATAYVGEQGRLAASFSVEYEILFTQRLVLQSKLELELYSKEDRANAIGSGLADSELALRLRYEIRRELAPYTGIAWLRRYGGTADAARAVGADVDELQLVAGVRVWF